MDLKKIQLGKLTPTIFSDIAKEAAEYIRDDKKNKSTQIRKFYDELVMWDEKIATSSNQQEAYEQSAPFIHMIRAKVAYAKSRSHVNDAFENLMTQIMSEVNSPETLHHAKLFFEAVIGFRKANENNK